MLWFAIALGIAFVVWAIAACKGEDWPTAFALAGFTLFVAGFVALMPMNVLFANYGMHDKWVKTIDAAPLENIRDSSSTSAHGSMFLFVGSFYLHDRLTHAYYMKTSDGSIIEREIPAANDRIYEDNTGPSVTCWRLHRVGGSSWLSVFHKDYNVNTQSCDFHVPPGSVANDYSLGQ